MEDSKHADRSSEQTEDVRPRHRTPHHGFSACCIACISECRGVGPAGVFLGCVLIECAAWAFA
jgi:hypothetical protein